MRAKRTDSNQREIVGALRQIGWHVLDLSRLGMGVPDLLVCKRGTIRLIEVKAPNGTLTEAQEKVVSDGWPVTIIRSVQDVVTFEWLEAGLAKCDVHQDARNV